MPQLIEHVVAEDREVVMVQYLRGNWTFVFHSDPGLDFAVDPQGFRHTGIWDPFGPYHHPHVPQVLFDHVNGYFELLSA